MKAFLDKILDSTVPGLQKAMDLTWKRHEAISSNIANAETPQYRAIDLNFAGELERAFKGQSSEVLQTNAKHMDVKAESTAHIMPDLSGATKPDGNNVDIDQQMGQMSFNSGKYSNASRLLRKKLGMIKFAIRESAR